MAKIPKNLSDKDMLAGFKEPKTYEHIFLAAQREEDRKKAAERETLAKRDKLEKSFIEPELAKKIGKALLELKLELYKEGVVDYGLKVAREGKKILLEAVPPQASKRKN